MGTKKVVLVVVVIAIIAIAILTSSCGGVVRMVRGEGFSLRLPPLTTCERGKDIKDGTADYILTAQGSPTVTPEEEAMRRFFICDIRGKRCLYIRKNGSELPIEEEISSNHYYLNVFSDYLGCKDLSPIYDYKHGEIRGKAFDVVFPLQRFFTREMLRAQANPPDLEGGVRYIVTPQYVIAVIAVPPEDLSAADALLDGWRWEGE